MKAMIFAAGLGTRLKPFTDNHPKALAMVGGKTLLEHTILYLKDHGIHDVVVNVHHFADQIEETLKENNGFGSRVAISDERDMVLETGGGLLHAASHFEGEESFVITNVDVFTNLNLSAMVQTHLQGDCVATLAVLQHVSSRQLLFDEHGLLCGWNNVATGQQRIAREVLSLFPRAFTGIQVVRPGIFNAPFKGKFSMIDVYLHLAPDHAIKAFDHTGDYFLDVGKPESLAEAERLLA